MYSSTINYNQPKPTTKLFWGMVGLLSVVAMYVIYNYPELVIGGF